MLRLVPFNQVERSLAGLMTRETFIRLSKQGLAPQIHRLSPKGRVTVDIDEMASWLAEKGLPLLDEIDD